MNSATADEYTSQGGRHASDALLTHPAFRQALRAEVDRAFAQRSHDGAARRIADERETIAAQEAILGDAAREIAELARMIDNASQGMTAYAAKGRASAETIEMVLAGFDGAVTEWRARGEKAEARRIAAHQRILRQAEMLTPDRTHGRLAEAIAAARKATSEATS